MKHQLIGKHLEIHPKVCGGRLVFRGTRMPVELVLRHLGRGGTVKEAIENWPSVTREAIHEAVYLATMALVDITGARPWNREHDLPRPWERKRRKKPVRAKVA